MTCRLLFMFACLEYLEVYKIPSSYDYNLICYLLFGASYKIFVENLQGLKIHTDMTMTDVCTILGQHYLSVLFRKQKHRALRKSFGHCWKHSNLVGLSSRLHPIEAKVHSKLNRLYTLHAQLISNHERLIISTS